MNVAEQGRTLRRKPAKSSRLKSNTPNRSIKNWLTIAADSKENHISSRSDERENVLEFVQQTEGNSLQPMKGNIVKASKSATSKLESPSPKNNIITMWLTNGEHSIENVTKLHEAPNLLATVQLKEYNKSPMKRGESVGSERTPIKPNSGKNTTTKLKNYSQGNYSPIANHTRLKSKGIINQTSNLSKWLSKSDIKQTQKCSNTKNKNTKENNKTVKSNKSKTKPDFSRTVSDESFSDLPITNKNKKCNGKYRNNKLPTFKEIIAEQRNLMEYKKQVEQALMLTDSLLLPNSPEKYPEDSERNKKYKLDCEDITEQELKQLFYEQLGYLKQIFSGELYNERHQRYVNYKKTFEHTDKDLNYNTSMIVFTYTQIEYLVQLIQQELDEGKLEMAYIFKVLLPELCLKIFMKSHSMGSVEAEIYLDDRPID